MYSVVLLAAAITSSGAVDRHGGCGACGGGGYCGVGGGGYCGWGGGGYCGWGGGYGGYCGWGGYGGYCYPSYSYCYPYYTCGYGYGYGGYGMPGYGTPGYGTPGGGTPGGDGGKNKVTEAPAPATIMVNLPADASLIVDGQPVSNTGSTRLFYTPDLKPDTSYHYTFQVQVVREGRQLTQTRRVDVEAGKQSQVSFDFSDNSVASNR